MARDMVMAIFAYKGKAYTKALFRKISKTVLELNAFHQEIPIVASFQEVGSMATGNTSGHQETVTKEIFTKDVDTARVNYC